MDNILEVREVSKTYTNHKALDNVSISVPRGSVYGLLGPNGAGKTTLIRIINHITAPDSGTVLLDGHPLTAADTAFMGYLPEERGLYKKMKVGEQALFFARLKGLGRREATIRLHEWFERFDIMNWWNRKVEELSKGMAQKVQFIVTVLHRPKLLIFDEPFSGFDPINAGLLRDEILKLKNEGATVIFSTHNMASVEEICDDITLINDSRNILSGNVAELRHSYGHGRYSFSFEGEAGAVYAAITPMTDEMLTDSEMLFGNERHHITVKLKDNISVRELVNAVNSRVVLTSFNEVTVSMNDIFIKTVEEYSAANANTTY